jgi:hypothetical protein
MYSSGVQPGMRLPPGIREDISGNTRKQHTLIQKEHNNRFNYVPALILELNEDSTSSPNWDAGVTETSSIISLTGHNNINN